MLSHSPTPEPHPKTPTEPSDASRWSAPSADASSRLVVRFETEIGVVDIYFATDTPYDIIELLDKGLRLTRKGDTLVLADAKNPELDLADVGSDAWLTTPFKTETGHPTLSPSTRLLLARRMRPGSSLWPRQALLFELDAITGLPVLTSSLFSPEAL